MLSESEKNRLKSNWGERAEALACNAEIKLFDPLSSWECYFLAIDPMDEDNAKVIIVDEDRQVLVTDASVQDLFGKWNGQGEFMEIDPQFVPRTASSLFKVLNERNPV